METHARFCECIGKIDEESYQKDSKKRPHGLRIKRLGCRDYVSNLTIEISAIAAAVWGIVARRELHRRREQKEIEEARLSRSASVDLFILPIYRSIHMKRNIVARGSCTQIGWPPSESDAVSFRITHLTSFIFSGVWCFSIFSDAWTTILPIQNVSWKTDHWIKFSSLVISLLRFTRIITLFMGPQMPVMSWSFQAECSDTA